MALRSLDVALPACGPIYLLILVGIDRAAIPTRRQRSLAVAARPQLSSSKLLAPYRRECG